MKGNYIMVGDFNLPGIDWDRGVSDSKGRQFYEECREKFLEQHVRETTHINGNILDLVISNNGEIVGEFEMGGRLGNSDHDIIIFHLYKEDNGQQKIAKTRNYYRGNYEMMRTEMATMRWDEMMRGKDVNGMWLILKNRLNEMVEKHIP